MKIVEVWPKGYAHEDGPKRIVIADDADPKTAAKKFGMTAVVYAVRPIVSVVTETISDAYARQMSKYDNS